MRLQNLICAFQDARMMEDEHVRSYIGRILEIVVRIRSHGGTKLDDEVIWTNLKTPTPPFKTIAQMIQLMIACIEKFTKETLLGRLEAEKLDLKQFGELTTIEIAFSALNVKPSLARNTSVQNDFAINIKIVDEKIKGGVVLLIERELDGKKIFKFGHVMNMVIMHLGVLKEKESLRKGSSLKDLEISYMLMKKKKGKNLIRIEVKMNWDLQPLRRMILIEKLEKKVG